MNLGGSYQSSFFGQSASQACQGTHGGYVRCDQNADYFLDEMMRWLQEGVAGAAAFRADAALVVTWYNTASAISGRSDMDAGQLATYQVVWLTDEAARLSYVILNYDKLGFDAADFRANSRSGRCQVNALFTTLSRVARVTLLFTYSINLNFMYVTVLRLFAVVQ
ncbi:Nidogen-like protein [Oesophagostomum dentatum]|uniref:Nidogen-like protein n=1 Tax=Oesophagostomum dentatum TaxID=61180 RepID=A0A0B1SJW0_OESDE|nr:Nidogen-like protein [Oesophagostomum dentatum]